MLNSVCVNECNDNAAAPHLSYLKMGTISWIGLAICCLSLFCAHALQAQQPTQPPEPADSNPNNGEVYYFINQLSGLQMDLDNNSTSPGSTILQNDRTFTDLSQRWATTKMPDGNWKITNTRSGLCLDSTGGSSPTTVQNTCGINVTTQEWTFTYAGSYSAYKNTGNGYNAITNVGTGKLLAVSGGSTSSGADLVQTALSGGTPAGTQLWLFRAAFWRGDDITGMEKAEYDRASTNTCASSGMGSGSSSCNNQDLPWWHDAYLPGQDILQIFKNAGLNGVRVQPAGVTETLVHGNVTFDQTTGPYNGYSVGSGTSTTWPLTSTTQLIPTSASDSGEVVALSDWGGIDSAVRAKKLGLQVYVDLFSDGTSNAPGLWSAENYSVTDMVGTPENEHPPSNSSGGTYNCSGKNIVYNYVKQEMEMYRANGAFPDLFAAGDEIQGFWSIDGTSYAPSRFSSAAFQNAAFQGALDAASDTSNPSLLGNPIAPPLRCEDLGGGHDLQENLYSDTVTYGVKLDLVCQSYYPGWSGPLTQAQYNWKSGDDIEETSILAETDLGVTGVVAPGTTKEAESALGYPVFFPETGVAYTNSGGETPLDYWYGSDLSPSDASRAKERQFYIDIETVQESNPDHLGFGIECWSCESTSVSVNPIGSNATAGAVHQYWTNAQLGVFDNSLSTTSGSLPDAAAGTKPLDNATLPSMLGLGGKTDPAYNYMLVNANGGILETALASQSSGATLDVAAYNGIVSQHQQWKILAQGGDAELNGASYPTPLDHEGDGYFQIVNQNQTDGVFVLDNDAGTSSNSPVVQYAESVSPTAISGTDANQEWDILTVGNCGDIPANCTNPPLSALGDYYVIVSKKSGLLLALNGSSIEQQSPAAASNGDWIVPSAKGQLWQIVPVHISVASTPALLAFASAPPTSVATGGNLGTINVNVENTAQALIETPSESVTLAITGPQDYSKTVSSSAAVASFNLSGDVFNTSGSYTITATSSGLTSTSASFTVGGTCTPTAIVPYISVNGGSTWTEESSATVSSTSTVVDIGPQPASGGSWSWTGPNGFTSTSRQISSIPLTVGTDSFVATYTNASGCKSTQTFTITVQ